MVPAESGVGLVSPTSKKTAALCVVLSGAIVYLSAHALTGRQGLLAYMELQQQERTLTAELGALNDEKIALEARADRMRPDALDLDYLEERARELLAAGNPNDLVFALDAS